MSINLSYDVPIAVRFELGNSRLNALESSAPIVSHDIYRGKEPYPGGVNDLHMGTTEHSSNCLECAQGKKHCIGHDGSAELNYPVWNVVALQSISRWLKTICFECGSIVIPDRTYLEIAPKKRLNDLASKTNNKNCAMCDAIHPIVRYNPDGKNKLQFVAEYIGKDKQVSKKEIIYPHIAQRIFEKITDETCITLNYNPKAHPRNFILTTIKVSPVAIRPAVVRIGGGRSTTDHITSALQAIIKTNSSIPNIIPNEIDPKLEKAIWDLNQTYYDMIRGGTTDADFISYIVRLKGKGGRLRKNVLGKRVGNMCRSTITGDPKLAVDEVGMPISFARTVQIEEKVQAFNYERIYSYVKNGRKAYPGASRIIKPNGDIYTIDGNQRLEYGDVVLRDILDGDITGFNRQPSLSMSSFGGHKVVVTRDPTIMPISMNVLSCGLYSADFDGDCMHLVISSDVAARNEIAEMSSVKNWLISHTTSSPMIGQVDDSIIGCAELTRDDVLISKYQAMRLFAQTKMIPDLSEKAQYTGREIVSFVLKQTPINFTCIPTWYDESYAKIIKYSPTETRVLIENGELKTGILDKKSIAKDTHLGVFHIIANEYGNRAALESIYNVQQLALARNMLGGYTVGINDLLISKEATEQINNIVTDMIGKSRIITEKLINGDIIAPINRTIKEEFEHLQRNTLAVFDDFSDIIVGAINPRQNNLFKLIAHGSKGKINNFLNMSATAGQKIINGELARENFGPGRTLPYFPRFSFEPEARGFICNSFLHGMNSSEYIFNAAASRFDLITKALSTSITGEQNRKSVKNLESLIVNNARMCVKDLNIIMPTYGDDYIDPRKLERVKFPTIFISNAAFREKYYNKDFTAFFEQMEVDRAWYRAKFGQIEKINMRGLMSDVQLMPVNVERIIKELYIAGSDNLREKVDLVDKSLSIIHRNILLSDNEILVESTRLLKVLIRSYLNPNSLTMSIESLHMIIDRINLRFIQALIDAGTAVGIIAAQSFSEPLTQYMLDAHHRSASGGTSKSGINKAKEILGARHRDQLSAPSMLIPIKDQSRVAEIANTLEVMKFEQFVQSWQIFFEKYGEPVHSRYAHEKADIEQFLQNNPLQVAGDLIRWCARFEINKSMLIIKNMTVDQIIIKLRAPTNFIVYTNENSSTIFIRVYFRATEYKSPDLKLLKSLVNDLMLTAIRGLKGLLSATATEVVRTFENANGAIENTKGVFSIITLGTNLAEVLSHPDVDPYGVLTSSVQETFELLGIEAAFQRLLCELQTLVENCNGHHFLLYANEMTYTGYVTAIESSGIKAREPDNTLLQVGTSNPYVSLCKAALDCSYNKIYGITAAMAVGVMPKIGTRFNGISMNLDFIRANTKSADDLIDSIM